MRGTAWRTRLLGKRGWDILEGTSKSACQPKEEDVSTQGRGVHHDDTGSSCHTGGGAMRADKEIRSELNCCLKSWILGLSFVRKPSNL